MFDIDGYDDVKQAGAAIAQLLIGDVPLRRPQGHRVMFTSATVYPKHMRQRTLAACERSGMDCVVSIFGPEPLRGPRRIILFKVKEGRARMFDDCVLWADEDGGPLVLVPRGANRGRYIFDGDNMAKRKGRPAFALGEGMLRADIRFRDAVRRIDPAATEVRTVYFEVA